MTMKAMGKHIVRQVCRTGAYKERERGSWCPFIPITGVQRSEGCEHEKVDRSAKGQLLLFRFQEQAAGKINMQFGCRPSHGPVVFSIDVVRYVIGPVA